MVKIRLMRMGAKKAPFYRVVVANATSARGGRFIENLGYYDPGKKPQIVELHEDRVFQWLANGAVPTETVRSLFRQKGILRRWQEMRRPSAPKAAGEGAEGAGTAEA